MEPCFHYSCKCYNHQEQNEDGDYECGECGKIDVTPFRRFQGGTTGRPNGD